jgi:hypothetical protein
MQSARRRRQQQPLLRQQSAHVRAPALEETPLAMATVEAKAVPQK